MANANPNARDVMAIRERIAQGVGPAGLIGPHLAELQSLPPEIAGIELMPFQCSITSAGVITQPAKLSTPQQFYAELTEIVGYIQTPATDPELMALTFFDVRDGNRNGSLFSAPIDMGFITSTQGPAPGLKFERGLYVFDPGTRVEVQFSIDGDSGTGYVANASATKRWSVLLKMNLFAVRKNG